MMKDKFKVTARDIDKLPDGRHTIDDNLSIKVTKDGKYKNYYFRAQINGEKYERSLGSARDLSFAMAKAKAVTLRARIANGEDIFADQKKEKRVKLPTFGESFMEAIDITNNARKWSDKQYRDWIVSITNYACPTLKDKRVDQIDRDDVIGLLADIWESKPPTAGRVRLRLERIFDYYIFKGWYTQPNPAKWKGNLDMVFPSIEKINHEEHHEAMTQIEASYIAKRFADSEFMSHKLIMMGLLTATRVNEFANARWDEIDFETATWSIPPERRKDKKRYPHRVPLPIQLISILNSIERRGELIFVDEKGKRLHKDTPRIILIKNLKRKVSMHGCRSTFRDWCAENDKDAVLAEKSLMHATGNEVEQAYQRSDQLEQRRVLMQEWADFLLK